MAEDCHACLGVRAAPAVEPAVTDHPTRRWHRPSFLVSEPRRVDGGIEDVVRAGLPGDLGDERDRAAVGTPVYPERHLAPFKPLPKQGKDGRVVVNTCPTRCSNQTLREVHDRTLDRVRQRSGAVLEGWDRRE